MMGSLTISTMAKPTAMTSCSISKEWEGIEIIRGAEECYAHSKELLKGLRFPGGVMPLSGLEECGLVRETGYVWMRQGGGKPCEHNFRTTGTWVRCDAKVMAYAEEGRMKRMTGVWNKQMMLWVPIIEISLDGADRVYFKSNVGIGGFFPAAAFADDATPATAAAPASDGK